MQEGEKIVSSCYFIVDTYIDGEKDRGMYDEYIQHVKPIVESFGGEYLVRSENITYIHQERKPQRVIIIRFPSRQELDKKHDLHYSIKSDIIYEIYRDSMMKSGREFTLCLVIRKKYLL